MSPAPFAGRHLADSPEWYTPDPIVIPARQALGGTIDLDPMSHPEANARIGATRIYTVDDNGLDQPWYGRVLVNPPTGLVAAAWEHLLNEWRRGRLEAAVWVGYSLEQLQTLQGYAWRSPAEFPFCIPRRRIAFVENAARRAIRLAELAAKNAARQAQGLKPLRGAGGASHANYLAYLGRDRRQFAAAFAATGHICNLHKGARSHAEGTPAPRETAAQTPEGLQDPPDHPLVHGVPAPLGRKRAADQRQVPLSGLFGGADDREPDGPAGVAQDLASDGWV